MGSSSSSKANSERKAAESYALLIVAERKAAERKAAEARAAEQTWRSAVQGLHRKVNEIEESLKTDKSQANVIAQFAKVIEIEGLNKMDCVKEIVHSMGDGWREIMHDEKCLSDIFGYNLVNNLKHIRDEYFALLSRTNVVIAGLLIDSEIQKEHVDGSLRVVNKAMSEGEAMLSEVDRLEYDESIQNLVKWIDQTELVEITKEWNVLCQKLEVQINCLIKAAESVVDNVKNASVVTKMGSGLGRVLVSAAIIGVIILTAGVGALVFADIAIVSNISSNRLTGGFVCGYFIKPIKIAAQIGKITDMLEKYIQTCKVKNIEKRATKFDLKTCGKIASGLRKIDTYLDTYMEQGNDLVLVIEQACKEFIKN